MLKYELIPEQLFYEGVISDENFLSPEIIKDSVVILTHQVEYYTRLKNLQLSAAEERRIGFKVSPKLVEREMRIAQGTIDGSISALENGVSFNIAGGTHHAGTNWGEGFCMLNDHAIAANYLLDQNLASKILIVDLDVHQGNGTAEIFKNEKRVFTFSMHGMKNFPFRKEKSDLDIGLNDGTSDQEYLKLLNEHLTNTFITFKPDFVFYQAGVDVLGTDKLGKLNLSTRGCKNRDITVFNLCRKYNCPVQVSMGGGYSPKINDIVQAHCNTFKAAVELYF
ncbi:MAG: histone deacetylase [Flavobacterium sp.]|nr:histone deacetylase [Pedobacter sp.]